uniref:AlNc14C22G2240 protein n=1 Tax=Albugo laibachii Nc14 TaxID=890382 RepID=F0W5S5_9STRA|nr:AlNc14C22G2240 [Albugo laibachii Nc14]|eukprot:CCA16466.1 AlNc14C22G2240 [Albugo laibachii Nc14]
MMGSFHLCDIAYGFPKCEESENTESANIQIWDSSIRDPIEELANAAQLAVKIGRNQEDEYAAAERKKPDFLIWLCDALVFKGEEKASASDFEIAEEEVFKQMKSMSLLFFGKMPYLFAYVAAKYHVRFLSSTAL